MSPSMWDKLNQDERDEVLDASYRIAAEDHGIEKVPDWITPQIKQLYEKVVKRCQ